MASVGGTQRESGYISGDMSPFLKFLLSGGVAAGVNLLSRLALSTVIPYEAAVVLAYIAGMVTAYLLMRLFVFEASGQTAVSELSRFTLVNMVALVQVWIVSVGLARWLFPTIGFVWHAETVAHAIGVLSPVVTSYFGHKRFSFRNRNA